MVGMAVRSAHSLGMHLTNANNDLSDAEKEVRYRKWYALYNLERLTTVLTGRPTAIHEHQYNVPVPTSVDEHTLAASALEAQAARGARSSSSHGQQRQGPPSSSRSSTEPLTNNPPSSSMSRAASRIGPQPPNKIHSHFFLETVKLNKICMEILNKLYSAGIMKRRWNEVQEIIQDLAARLNSWRTNLPPVLVFGKRQNDQVHARQVGSSAQWMLWIHGC